MHLCLFAFIFIHFILIFISLVPLSAMQYLASWLLLGVSHSLLVGVEVSLSCWYIFAAIVLFMKRKSDIKQYLYIWISSRLEYSTLCFKKSVWYLNFMSMLIFIIYLFFSSKCMQTWAWPFFLFMYVTSLSHHICRHSFWCIYFGSSCVLVYLFYILNGKPLIFCVIF